jgi:hypothetical protein
MFVIAGGILLAIFAIFVIFGLIFAVRDSTRFVFRFIGANVTFVTVISVIFLVGVGAKIWISLSESVEAGTVLVPYNNPSSVKCTGNCVYR